MALYRDNREKYDSLRVNLAKRKGSNKMKTIITLTTQRTKLPVLNQVIVKDGIAFGTDCAIDITCPCTLENGVYESKELKAGLIRPLPGVGEKDFPESLNVRGESVTFETTTKGLVDAFAFISPAMSKDETRFYVMGAHVTESVIEATDGHRLHRFEWNNPALAGLRNLIIPSYATKLFLSLVKESKESEVKVTFWAKYVRFELGQFVLTSKLIDGEYPDTDRVIPATQEKGVAFDSAAFMPLAKAYKAMASKNTRGLLLDGESALVQSGERIGVGKESAWHYTSTRIGPDPLKMPFKIAFNPQYLADTCLQGKMFFAACKNPAEHPVTIREGQKIAVVMPMRA